MAEHTPGPWVAKPHQFGGCWWVDTVDGSIQVSMTTLNKDEANARFIAAAPDMEKALEVISGSPHGANCDGFGARRMRFQCSCHVLIAKAAIAKAK